jgi:hypothetical protein
VKGIPPEIDRMMWTVAEQENAAAAEEFLQRYPIYREELLRRRQAVSGLKTSRPIEKSTPHAIPRFVPREARRQAPAPRQVAVVSGLVLAALAVASYTATTLLTPPPAPTPKVEPVVPSPHKIPQRVTPHRQTAPSVDVPPVTPAPEKEPTKSEEVPKYLRPQSLVVKTATLADVLKLLGAQAGVKIVVAPGMPNPTIDVEYHDLNALEILHDLGAQYRFTPFDQGDGSIIVYPAVDDSGSTGVGNIRRLGG